MSRRRVGSKGTAASAGLKFATSDVQHGEDALTTAIDVMSAADILAGLPDRISEGIAPHVAERPTHPAFVEGGRTWSYREFAKAVDAVAADFVRLQIRPGDRVLLASENSVALASFIFACSTLDAWPVVVNPRLSPRELDQIHVHSGARRIFSYDH